MAKGTATFSLRAAQSRETIPTTLEAPMGPETKEALAVRATETMNSHPGLVEARQKLRELDDKRAALQAEYDQVQSAVSNPDVAALAERVLDGDNLDNVDAVVARRDTLKQKLLAYQTAMNRQRIEVEKQLRIASRCVCDLIAPLHRMAVNRLLECFSEIQAATDELSAVKHAMDCSGALADSRLVYFGTQQIQQNCREFASMRANHWNAWLEQHG